MNRHRLRRVSSPALLAAASTLVLGACQDTLRQPAARPIGYLALTVDGDAAPDKTVPTATFFRAQGVDLPDSRGAGDQCQVLGFVANPGQGNAFPGVSAGGELELELASGKVKLQPTDTEAGRVYALPQGGSVAINSGETATLRVPGDAAGFPATTFTIETVKPFDFQPIPQPSASGDVNVSWSNSGTAGVAMYLSLRYQAAGQSSVQTQVLCFLADDGAHTIPADVLAGWRSAASSNRSAVATRIRTAASTLSVGDAAFYALSTFTRNVPIAAQ